MLTDLLTAFAFLTIIPLRYREGRKAGYAFAYFPLVGLVIGTILVLVALLLPLGRDLNAFLLLLLWVLLTGGLHLDGFADSCDGLLATTSPEKRLEIMKDPRAGSWAVVGVVLLLLGKWLLLREIPPALLLIPPMLGRWNMVMVTAYFPYARPTGLGAYFRDGLGKTQLVTATLMTIFFVGGVSLAVNPVTLLVLILAPLGAGLIGRWAAERLGGGLTGDVYGAVCELTEFGCLLGLLWLTK